MLRKMLTAACLTALLCSGAASAQTTAPAPTATPAVPGGTPYTPTVRPSQRAPASTTAAVPTGTKVNLNTASAAELDKLPKVGKARTKVIMDERAKSPFKDWADFDTRTKHTSVNNGVKNSIKDMVSF